MDTLGLKLRTRLTQDMHTNKHLRKPQTLSDEINKTGLDKKTFAEQSKKASLYHQD